MEMIFVGIAAVAVVAWLLIRRRPAPDTQRVQTPAATPTDALDDDALLASRAPAPANFEVAVVPAEVMALQAIRSRAPSDTAWIHRLRDLPRPPRALQQLTSPAFLQKATSVELAELVLSEPHVAAKVLATVNSPLYGLRTPVEHIGQGITFLGLNTVRGICLQHLLNQAFPAASHELRAVFDPLWKASAVGSELCAKLAAKLGIAQGGGMVTQVVLSYLGPMAALTILPPDTARSLAGAPLLTRMRVECEALGMGGADVGYRLMNEWGLPKSVVQSVSAMDHMLDTPIAQPTSDWTATALSYWCARMGERMVRGEWTDTSDWLTWADDTHPETAVTCHYLRQTLGERLTQALQDPALSALMRSATRPLAD